MTSTPVTLTVGLLTYKRPLLLPSCLDSLIAQRDVPCTWSIVVVDNDPAGSARSIVEIAARHTEIPIKYLIEPVPGIAAGRNRVVEAARRAEYLVFIDDDEWADPYWLSLLLKGLKQTLADVGQGSVRAQLEPGGPAWASKTTYFDRPLPEHGTTLSLAATNNVIVRVGLLSDMSAPFRIDLGTSGDDDTDLFVRLRLAGAQIVSLPEATVTEVVPLTRQSYKWLLRRSIRGGAGWVDIERRYLRTTLWRTKRVVSLFLHLAEFILFGVASIAAFGRGTLIARSVHHLGLGIGIFQGLFGRHFEEYRR